MTQVLETTRIAPPTQDAGVSRNVITVCHPVWRMERGGLERQLSQTLSTMAKEGIRHHIIIRGNSRGATEGWARGSNVTVEDDGREGADANWSETLAEAIQRSGADLLHVRGLSMLLDGSAAARRTGIPLVFSFHGFEAWPPRIAAWRKEVYRAAVMQCADRWAVGTQAARAIEKALSLPEGAIGVVANGVDPRRFRPAVDRNALRAGLALPTDRLILLCVGNLKPIKGHDTLIRAFVERRELRRCCLLVIVGRDYSGGRLAALAARETPGDSIRFVGETEDPLPWYQAADVFVLPSRFEGMSNALLEAMACGLPSIATAVGGNLELVTPERTGLLLHSDDTAAMGNAMMRLAEDADLRARMGAAAREYVARRHAIKDTAEKIAARYRAAASINKRSIT